MAQRRLNPQWVEFMRAYAQNNPYFRLQSMGIASLDVGRASLEIELGEQHMQVYGVVHGGVTASILDATGYWACYTAMDPGPGLTTVEMKLNYLGPCRGGRLISYGENVKVGGKLALAQVRVEDHQANLVAHGTVTLMILPSTSLPGQDKFPPKFI